MKIAIVIYALVLLSLVTRSQVIHRDLLHKKYSIQSISTALTPFNKWKPFPQSPQEWTEKVPDSILNLLIENGEQALKRDFPVIPATIALEFTRNGNRTDYEAISFTKRVLLWDLVIAESIEGKGRFTDHIVDGIWSVCEESFWGASAHLAPQKAGVGLPDVEDPIVDLFAAETAADLAWTDYFVGPQLDKVSKLLRSRISYEVNRRVFIPMSTTKYGWMGKGDPEVKLNNWAPWIMSNYLIADLLLQKDGQKRLEGVNTVMNVTDQYINGLGDDGACEEGPAYWAAAAGCVFDVLNVLNDASTGMINIYKEPIIEKMAAYIYKTHIGGKYFVNVADAHPQIEPEGVMIYRFGKAVNDEKLASFGSWICHNYGSNIVGRVDRFRNVRALYNLMALKDIEKADFYYSEVKDAWFPDVQMMISRLSNGLFVSCHGGTNGESHNHNDVGDFIIYADGNPVIIDVGSGTYTSKTFSNSRYAIWYNTSAYHNLPTIDHIQQKDGINYAATHVKYQSDNKESSLQVNIDKAYPAETNLSGWQRTISTNKVDRIEILDGFSFRSPVKSLTQSFMTVCNSDISEPGKIIFTTDHDKKVLLQYDATMWNISKEKMDLTAPEDQALKVTWMHKDIYRIALTATHVRLSGTAKYVITTY